MGFKPRNPKRKGTLWHMGFAQLVSERAPAGIQVLVEFLLSLHPRRADLLLLRRAGRVRRDHEARVLRGLWPRLGPATLVEFKSPSRGFRQGDLLTLVSYGAQFHQGHYDELSGPEDLSLVLVVPCLSETLAAEIAHMRSWRLEPLDGGYARIVGVMYATYVVFTNEVSAAEEDDYLRIFSQHATQSREAAAWLQDWLVEEMTMEDIRKREGYDEVLAKLLGMLPPEERLAGLTREQTIQALAGLAPQERLAGLTQEQTLLALPDEVLCGLSEEYIRSLPRSLQRTIRRRLAKAASADSRR